MKRLAFLALVVLAHCANAPAYAGKPPGPELIIRPRISIMQPRGVTVVATVRILRPVAEMYCPEVTFEWGESVGLSKVEADCDPQKEGEALPDFYLTRSWVYGTGVHKIVVNIKQGKKEIRLEGIAEVQGE